MIIEQLKQQITAKADKIKRYESRVDQYQQNRLFQNNHKRLFTKLEGLETDNSIIPDAKETREYWNSIWSKQVTHSDKALWINEVEKDHARIEKQSDIEITTEMIAKQASKLTYSSIATPS